VPVSEESFKGPPGDLKLSQPNVLVLTDDSDFAKGLLARWQRERVIPSFTVSGNEALNGAEAPACDLAIVGRIGQVRLIPVLKALDSSARPAICLCESSQVESLRSSLPRTTFLAESPYWSDMLTTVGVEVLRRIEAQSRARKSEQVVSKIEHEAALGRYMLESRHALNNALTSILGNAELLLLEPAKFPSEVHDQLETIHTMSLRIHEMFYRFSSMENERRFAEKASHSETRQRVEGAAAGD
jgi:signal transduction histidine kinase